MAVGFPLKTTYADGDVYSASDVNDITGTINLLTSSTLSYQAGKNAIINGGMDIWQRGTSFVPSTGTYTADRWQYYRAVAGSTVSRQVTNDTTIYSGNSLESVNSIPMAGKAVTFSFYARKGANFSGASSQISISLRTGTGTDQNVLLTGYVAQAIPITLTPTLTTTWQRFSGTATIAAATTEMGIYTDFTPVGTAGAADYYEITGVQVELGSTPTTFSRAGGTIQGELAACQRYYYKLTNGVVNAALMSAFYYSASSLNAYVPFPVTMRTSPAIDQVTGTNYYSFVRNGGTDTFNSFTLDQANATGVAIYNNSEASGTAGQAGYVFANNASAYLAFTSEL
jgi:hypothetical protein